MCLQYGKPPDGVDAAALAVVRGDTLGKSNRILGMESDRNAGSRVHSVGRANRLTDTATSTPTAGRNGSRTIELTNSRGS